MSEVRHGACQLLIAFPIPTRFAPSRTNKAAGIICEMANALQTTSYALTPTDDVEESPSVPEKKTSLPSVFSRLVSALKTALHAPSPTRDVEESPSVPEKKTLLPSVFWWPVSLLRWFPFLSSVIIYSMLTGSVAVIIYFHGDTQESSTDVVSNKTGVSGATFEVCTDTMYHRLHHRKNNRSILMRFGLTIDENYCRSS